MGGGILPVAEHKGHFYFLFARERLAFSQDKDRGKWSDFGGSREGKEIQYQTAVREGFEESNGILGNKKNIRNLIKYHLIKKIKDDAYSIWIVKVNYDPTVIKSFNQNFKHTLKYNPHLVKEKNGLFEKDKLVWIKLQDLKKKQNMFRYWYRRFIPRIIDIFDK